MSKVDVENAKPCRCKFLVKKIITTWEGNLKAILCNLR